MPQDFPPQGLDEVFFRDTRTLAWLRAEDFAPLPSVLLWFNPLKVQKLLSEFMIPMGGALAVLCVQRGIGQRLWLCSTKDALQYLYDISVSDSHPSVILGCYLIHDLTWFRYKLLNELYTHITFDPLEIYKKVA